MVLHLTFVAIENQWLPFLCLSGIKISITDILVDDEWIKI